MNLTEAEEFLNQKLEIKNGLIYTTDGDRVGKRVVGKVIHLKPQLLQNDSNEEENECTEDKTPDGETNTEQTTLKQYGFLSEETHLRTELQDMDDDELNLPVSSETESGQIEILGESVPTEKAHIVNIEKFPDGNGYRVDRCSCPDYYHRGKRHGYKCKHMEHVSDVLNDAEKK